MLIMLPVVYHVGHDEKAGDHVDHHYTGTYQGYLVGLKVVFAGFGSQGLGPYPPNLFYHYLLLALL